MQSSTGSQVASNPDLQLKIELLQGNETDTSVAVCLLLLMQSSTGAQKASTPDLQL